MIINPITNRRQSSFKAIKLSDSERKKSEELMRSLVSSSELESDTIKLQIYELYDKHLQKEADLKLKRYHFKEDFMQEMFLKFFEMLENIRKKIFPIENFIPALNDIKPTNNELMSGVIEKSIDAQIANRDDSYLKNI